MAGAAGAAQRSGSAAGAVNQQPASHPPAAWDARAWWDHFQERAGMLEHDGGLPCREAERRAFGECMALWLWSHPPDPCPPECCACCSHPIPPRGEGAVPLLRVVEPTPDHVWVHERCLERFREQREALARNFFAACGLGEPPP